jgi:acetyl esterase
MNVRSIQVAIFACLSVLWSILAVCSDEPERLDHNDPAKYNLAENVLWASPDGFDLTMDIYTPRLEEAPLPVIVMFHGGGWLINDNSIMDQSAAYLATSGRYVVCNVNYRLLADNDNRVTMNQIVEDAFGAVLWVQDHISRYGGDPMRLTVTGDSAGGHLAAMIVNSGQQLTSGGFAGQPLGFTPSYLPQGKTAEALAAEGGIEVQAAILSYGAFDIYQGALDGFERIFNPFWLLGGVLPRGIFGSNITVETNPEMYIAASPVYNIAPASQRKLPPQLLSAGSEDSVVTPASVQLYAGKLREAGHLVEYWEYAGRPHAFLDSGSNWMLGIRFEDDAPPALDVMLNFLDAQFYQ